MKRQTLVNERKDRIKYRIAFSLAIVLLFIGLLVVNKRSIEADKNWASEAWNELVANNYESFIKDNYYIEYIEFLDDMKVTHLNKK